MAWSTCHLMGHLCLLRWMLISCIGFNTLWVAVTGEILNNSISKTWLTLTISILQNNLAVYSECYFMPNINAWSNQYKWYRHKCISNIDTQITTKLTRDNFDTVLLFLWNTESYEPFTYFKNEGIICIKAHGNSYSIHSN